MSLKAKRQRFRYRMDLIGADELGRIRWRGTGFCPDPGGLTWISEGDLRRAIVIFQDWLAVNDPPVLRFGESVH